MIGVTNIEFEKEISFKIDNILEGFDNYSSGIIEGKSYEDLDGFLKECNKENEDIIVDYYGNTLEEKFFSNIMNNLNKDEELLIKKIKDEFKDEYIYFKNLNEEEISLINKLSINSILFSTYNLVKEEVIIWSNYEKKFPIFFKDNKKIREFKNLCMKHNLDLTNLNIR